MSFTSFQFHKGTIKTVETLAMEYEVDIVFQFHKGTIKTQI